MRSIVVLAALLTCTIAVRAQNTEPRIWQGVYTAAQAERGKASFNSSCLRCHGDKLQGNTAPALSGDRFYTSWGNEVIASLFAKIRDTMPPNFGTSIDDQVKLDIVTYILQTNGYPAGPSELTQNGSDLASAQILKKGEQALVQNFSLVQTVGCLARGPDNSWILTRTADPLVTRDDVPSAQGLCRCRDASAWHAHVPPAECEAVQPRVTSGPQDGSARLDLQRARRRAAHADVAADGGKLRHVGARRRRPYTYS